MRENVYIYDIHKILNSWSNVYILTQYHTNNLRKEVVENIRLSKLAIRKLIRNMFCTIEIKITLKIDNCDQVPYYIYSQIIIILQYT